MTVKIRDYDKILAGAERRVKESDISEKNKEIIVKFEDHIIALGLSKPRVIKYLSNLVRLATWLEKDFDTVTKEDTKRVVKKIKCMDYSEWTKHSFCVVLKRFYKWLYADDEEYPKEVNWIRNNVTKDKLKLPGDGDLLSENEIERMIYATKHPRNKAFISMLYESGARIGELATLQLKHVTIDKNGLLLTLFGKTGARKIRIVNSTPYVMSWLEIHELNGDQEAPFWLNIDIKRKTRETYITYKGIQKLLKETAKAAEIQKRIYPHLFRHSRATFMANHLTEFQMNQYFGWAQGSDMPATYVHLSGRDMDTAVLKMNGMSLDEDEQKQVKIKPIVCPRCDTINSHDSSYCKKCTAILDEKLRIESESHQDKRNQMDQIMNTLIQDPEFKQMMMEKLRTM